VSAVVAELRRRSARDVLDLGCGVGRHALYLASQGFNTFGTDASPAGIEEARAAARRHGLRASFQVENFLDLSFPDQSFDFVLAWNVVYHGDEEIARTALDGVRRVLRPGGLLQSTMLSKRNTAYGVGEEVAPDTYVDPGDPGDKGHPHFYCDARTLVLLHHGFEVLELVDVEQRPGAWHWHLVMERTTPVPGRGGAVDYA
jgi:tellurite methyltransferase